MSPALALAYWWDANNSTHTFENCNLFVATRPDKAIPNVMTIYDIEPERYRSVDSQSVRHAKCRIDVRADNYMNGWAACQAFVQNLQTVEAYASTADEGFIFEIGHGTIRTGPAFRGSIPEENLELFTMTVSFQFGFTAT